MFVKKILLILLLSPLFIINVHADTSKSSIVMEMNTGRILYQRNAHEKRLIASTTKLMTTKQLIVSLNKKNITKNKN